MNAAVTPIIARRAYQQEVLRAFAQNGLRMFSLLWERQSGKSTTFSDMALFEMMRYRWRTCIYASASLLLAQEIVLKQRERIDISAREIIEKEAGVLHTAAARYSNETSESGLLFQTADSAKDKVVSGLTPSDFAELFESQRLEFRVYHDKTSYSRTKVIAPNIATARSWTGTVFLDEVAFIRGLKELLVAVLPIISTNPNFKLILGTTPPEFDDTHYSFELLVPPAGLEFRPNPAGNWYESEGGIRVHRADAYDTHAAGKKIYDLQGGQAITPEEAFIRAPNKDGHRIAHFLQWLLGGAAAVDLLRLKVAQERGVGECACFVIDSDTAFDGALAWIEKHLDPIAPIGLGFDVATTTRQKSNPSVLTICEERGFEYVFRAMLVWKTRDPDVARERLDRVVRLVAARQGGAARALAIDATNEKYFAEDVRTQFISLVPVLLVVASERVEKPGLENPTNWKQHLGDQLVSVIHDNHAILPPEQYVRSDFRLVRKERGQFVCEPDGEGRHGDTFDSAKLAIHALSAIPGVISSIDGIRVSKPRFSPRRLIPAFA